MATYVLVHGAYQGGWRRADQTAPGIVRVSWYCIMAWDNGVRHQPPGNDGLEGIVSGSESRRDRSSAESDRAMRVQTCSVTSTPMGF